MERGIDLRNLVAAAALLGAAAGGASAQPKFIHTSNASDLTADGNSVIGTILDPNVQGRVHVFTRGSGHTFPGPILPSFDGQLRVADDLSAASCSLYNGLFGPRWPQPPVVDFGTYANTGHGHYIPHRLLFSTNTWTNVGSLPGVAGLGAAKCDTGIASAYDISSNGRFITGGSWYGPFGATACGMRGFIIDTNDGSAKILPMVGTGCQAFSQGERVSTNGNVVMGSDSHTSPDGVICNARCLTVWERDTATGNFLNSGRTILDGWGAGGLSAGAMNRAGTIIAASMSTDQAIALGDAGKARNLFKYIKNTGTGAWDRLDVGRCADRESPCVCMKPLAISDDGNTIVGNAQYGTDCSFFGGSPRPFIWRLSVNEGVPIDLADYLQSINGGTPFAPVSVGQGISADGNAILATLSPPAPNCPPNSGLQGLSQAGILYLNGSGIGCEPPRVAGGPYDALQSEYTPFGIIGNVFVSGSYPLTLQWQKEMPSGSNNWVPISDSCGQFQQDSSWTYEGTTGFQLRINMLAPAASRDGRYRVVVTNSCGSATSAVANVSVVSGACCHSEGGQILCSIELPTRCTSSFYINGGGGVYLGDNTTCTPTACDAVIGACCFGAGGVNASCALTVAPNCTAGPADSGYSGSFAGNGTTCAPSQCNLVAGACCYSLSNTSDAICTVEVASRCNTNVAGGGVAGAYRGNGTTCSPTACSTVAGACCYAPSNSSDVICTIQTQTRCTNLPQLPSQQNYFSGLQGIYVGAGTTCLPVNQQCGFVAGACCYSLSDTSDSVCTLQLQDKCTRATNNNGLGGSYRGDGTTCSPSSCTTVTGACCYSTFSDPTTILCTIQPQARCTGRFFAGGLFGAYLGGGTTCSPTACASAVGACCYTPAGGTCNICTLAPADSPASATSQRCSDPVNGGLGGTFSGRSTTCGPSSCNGTIGACCVPATACQVSCLSDCTAAGGNFTVGVLCAPTDPCSIAQGACCRGTTCAIDTQANCTGFASGYAGNNTVCNSFGVNNTTPCCLADYNHVGGVGVQDIFDFLAGYFSGDNKANINGGAIGVQDIFDFLAVYFAGC